MSPTVSVTHLYDICINMHTICTLLEICRGGNSKIQILPQDFEPGSISLIDVNQLLKLGDLPSPLL